MQEGAASADEHVTVFDGPYDFFWAHSVHCRYPKFLACFFGVGGQDGDFCVLHFFDFLDDGIKNGLITQIVKSKVS